MKPGRYLIPLVAAVVVLVLALVWLRLDEAALPPEPSSAPAEVMQAEAFRRAPAPAAVASPDVASLATIAASAIPASPSPDLSRMQREIQIAISSSQRGRAGEAARLIQACQGDESVERWERKGETVHRLPLSEAVRRQGIASFEQLRTSCQAVDAVARSQLVPLLRRSVAEGDVGAAASLAGALEPAFDWAAEHAVVTALRRDAWYCDAGSQSLLSIMVRQHPKLLTPSELGALNELARARISADVEVALRKSPDNPELKAAVDRLRETYKAPPGADPAEVARIAADINSRCKPER